MTRVKLCGMKREEDILAVNELKPEYIGFIFVRNRRRYIAPAEAERLKSLLDSEIKAVGVFIDESAENVAYLLNKGIIDIAQLHGSEDREYIRYLKALTDRPLIKAFRITEKSDMSEIESCEADYVLLDSGAGSGKTFEWSLIRNVKRPYFFAGGLDTENVSAAVEEFHPFAVDVSSGIETDGVKDRRKMAEFLEKVRKD